MSSLRSPAVPAVKYLPFKKFHIASITDLSEESVKVASYALKKDRQAIKLGTIQNYIAKSLGFRAGFAGFKQEVTGPLPEFMREHGLVKCSNLVAPRDDFACMIKLGHRQIADRLFDSQRLMPSRLFTGYDIDWYGVNNRWFRHNPWKPNGRMDCPSFDDVHRALKEAADGCVKKRSQLLEAAVAAAQPKLMFQPNLLDDMLSDFGSAKFDPSLIQIKRYFGPEHGSEARAKAASEMRDAVRIFRLWMEEQLSGWVDILRYNENLIFLRGRNGEYDFVFRGMRDEPFGHDPFGPYLRSKDVPKSNDSYHFKRWLYHHYRGNLEADQHRAEIHYYNCGGQSNAYPGEQRILRDWLIADGVYRPPAKSRPVASGFLSVKLGEELVSISDLITIEEFKAFLDAEPSYLLHRNKQRGLDRWDTVNADDAIHLPAAVTWYDANAYAAWVSRTRKLPVRLLTEDEHALLRGVAVFDPLPEDRQLRDDSIPWENWPAIGEFMSPDGHLIDGHPPYMEEADFQNLRYRFIPSALCWHSAPCGLRFLVSARFGEWLNEEGAAVNSAHGTSLCYGLFSPYRGKFSAKSTGKYKGMKVGFRLCYLTTDHPADHTD